MYLHGGHAIFAILLLAGVMHDEAGGQELVLSDRIGNEMSRKERDYFGLFPSLLDFESAHFIADTGGYVRAEVVLCERPTPRLLLMSEELFEELGTYIDSVDVAAEYDPAMIRFLGSLVDQQVRKRNAPKARILLTSGERIKARLFCTDTEGIGLIRRDEKYDRASPERLRVLSARDLFVVSTGRNNLGRGALIGLAVGGAIGYAVGISTSQSFELDQQIETWGSTALISLIGLVAGTMGGLIASDKQTAVIQGDPERYTAELSKLQAMSLHKAMPPELQRK